MQNIHDSHRQRVKEEFRQNGIEHFPDHKVLEMMLFYTFARGDTNELAHRLIERFGSLSGVLDAPLVLLGEVKGIGAESATYIKMVSSVFKRYLQSQASNENLIANPEAAKNYVKSKLLGEAVECLYFIALGANGRILFSTKLSEGSPDIVVITPSVVVKAALKADAAKVILAHNHPHGFSLPSSADVRTTQILSGELRRVDIELFDHIITGYGPDDVCSMREQGMIHN